MTYTPGFNYEGADSFTFSVSDGALSSNAVISITVTPGVDFFGFIGLQSPYQPPPRPEPPHRSPLRRLRPKPPPPGRKATW